MYFTIEARRCEGSGVHKDPVVKYRVRQLLRLFSLGRCEPPLVMKLQLENALLELS